VTGCIVYTRNLMIMMIMIMDSVLTVLEVTYQLKVITTNCCNRMNEGTWTKDGEGLKDKRNTYRSLVRKSERKRLLKGLG
jgi:hypothetical protein